MGHILSINTIETQNTGYKAAKILSILIEVQFDSSLDACKRFYENGINVIQRENHCGFLI